MIIVNPGQLTETEFNFIADQVVFKIREAKTLEEKEELVFKLLDSINADESTFFKNLYSSYDTTQMIDGFSVRFLSSRYKEAFIKDIEEHGFYIVRPPHKPILFDDIIRLYDAFPDIKPVDIYIDLFGTTQRKMLRKGIIGHQYLLILKQNSNKNFSARSTFRVNRSNLPAKDIAKKTNRSSYARTPVRLSEIYNILSSVSGTDLAEYNIFMRSSALGRKSLDRIISASGNPLKIQKLKVQDNFTNSNADILAAKLKTMGLRLYFSSNPEGRTTIWDDTKVCALHFGEYTIYDYPRNRKMYEELFKRFKDEMNKYLIIESYAGEKYDICWDAVFSDEELMKLYNLSEETKTLLKDTTKGHASLLAGKLRSNTTRKSSSSDTETTVHKKRGRKSKSEQEELQKQKEIEDLKNDQLESDSEEMDLDEEDDSDDMILNDDE